MSQKMSKRTRTLLASVAAAGASLALMIGLGHDGIQLFGTTGSRPGNAAPLLAVMMIGFTLLTTGAVAALAAALTRPRPTSA